jgi:hypothetical protein
LSCKERKVWLFSKVGQLAFIFFSSILATDSHNTGDWLVIHKTPSYQSSY